MLPHSDIQLPIPVPVRSHGPALFTTDAHTAEASGHRHKVTSAIPQTDQTQSGVHARNHGLDLKMILCQEHIQMAIPIKIAGNNTKNGCPLSLSWQDPGLKMGFPIQEKGGLMFKGF